MAAGFEKSSRGFTLIELMIVVAILGILAAIAIPTYSNHVAKAQFSEALSLASGVKTAVIDVYQQKQSLSGLTNGTYSIPEATDITGQFVSQVAVADGVITATFAESSALAHETVTLTPTPTPRSTTITWTCSTTVATARAPAGCR